ncbi:phage head completion protein [Sulfitobacter sp. SH24]|uniref:phage head completion protein n=1 Tax=Sulfitobacter sp. SH24 TaxID=3421173 RepID=UPI003F503CA8
MKLDRRIQLRRSRENDDGFSKVYVFEDHGPELWAGKVDVSDGEKMRAGEVSATITRRFVVPSMELTRGLTPKDQLVFEGVEYAIYGIKEIGTRWRLEITAGARVDRDNG